MAAAAASALLRTLQWALRALQLTSAALILAMHSYTLAALSNHGLATPTAVRAVEGISGVATAYALASLLVVCCLAGRFTFTSFVAVVLDFAFAAAFIYVAVANGGDSTGGCASGTLRTHFGKGKAGDRPKGKGGFTALPTFGSACKLQAACLAIAILCIFFFVFSILTEVALARQRQREKRHGAEPIPSTDDDNDEENPQGHGAHHQQFPDGDKKPSLFARIFRRGRKGAGAGEGESILPTHTTPEQLDGGDDIPPMQEQRHDDDDGYMHGGQHQHQHQQHQQNQLYRYQETYPEQNIGYATSIRDDDDTSYYGAGGPPPPPQPQPQPPSQVHHGHDDEHAHHDYHNGYRDEQDHGRYDGYDHDISNARPSQPSQPPQQQEQQTPGFGYPTAGYGLRPAGTGPGYHYDDGVYDGV